MKNNKIVKVINYSLYTVLVLGLMWRVYDLTNTFNTAWETMGDMKNHMEFQMDVITNMNDVILLQTDLILELEGDILILEDEVSDYRSQLIESNAERERVAQENAELKKSIADLHARAQRISANGANITENDRILLAQLVYSEARGESQTGQRAVVDVVLNRINDDRFPNTVREVIMAPRQFDEAHILHTYPATDALLQVVDKALKGNDVTNGALFFFNSQIAGCGWQWSRTQTAQIGQHRFSR